MMPAWFLASVLSLGLPGDSTSVQRGKLTSIFGGSVWFTVRLGEGYGTRRVHYLSYGCGSAMVTGQLLEPSLAVQFDDAKLTAVLMNRWADYSAACGVH